MLGQDKSSFRLVAWQPVDQQVCVAAVGASEASNRNVCEISLSEEAQVSPRVFGGGGRTASSDWMASLVSLGVALRGGHERSLLAFHVVGTNQPIFPRLEVSGVDFLNAICAVKNSETEPELGACLTFQNAAD